MSEPVTLYSPDGHAMAIVVAPSEVRRLEAEGWTREAPPPKPAPKPKTKKDK